MKAMATVRQRIISLPPIRTTIGTTITGIIARDGTPPLFDITTQGLIDYSEAQFYADLRKSSKKLDSMAKKAVEEHARGKTRKFPL